MEYGPSYFDTYMNKHLYIQLHSIVPKAIDWSHFPYSLSPTATDNKH